MISSDPSISVVITCFNYASYLGDAITSVLKQSRPASELIVVDDGSSDNSSVVAESFGSDIRLLRQTNQGQAAAGYAGFQYTQSNIILFLDADDLLAPEALERIAAAWSPAASKAQFDLAIIDSTGLKLGRRFCNFDPSYDARTVREQFAKTGTYLGPVMSGNAYSRAYLSRVLPLTDTRVLDGILNTVAPLYGDIITIPECLGYYRLHGSNFDNQGARTPDDPSRFILSIARRHKEIAALELHAKLLNVSLPARSPLDADIVFLNYRLMLKKLCIDYVKSEADSPWQLALTAFRVLLNAPIRIAAKTFHLLWVGALLISPAFLARQLITLRFNRAAIKRSVRPWLLKAKPIS